MPKSAVQSVSPSQLSAMSCRFSWYLAYRLGFSAVRGTEALEFGTGIHHALEQYYSKKADPVQTFREWGAKWLADTEVRWAEDAAKVADMLDLGVQMLEGYLRQYAGERIEVIATEATIRRRLPTLEGRSSQITLSARLDGLVRNLDDGRIYSLEHKTYSQFPGIDHLELDHQMTAQIWLGQAALKAHGLGDEKMAGVLYNGLRKQRPSSRVTTSLFERHWVLRTERQIEVFLHRAYSQAREHCQPGLAIYPQPDLIRCNWCDFKPVCLEYQRGGDWRFLLANTYQQRGPH